MGAHRTRSTEKPEESFTRRVLDSLFAFVGVLDPDGTLLEANKAPLEGAGLTIDDVRGRKFWDAYWWSYSETVQRQLEEACRQAAQGETVRYDVMVRMVGDSRMTIDFQVRPLRDETGRITHLVPTGVDITDRKRQEEELRRQAEEIEKLMDLVPAAIFVAHDPACLEMTGNQRAEEFYEADPDENVSAGASERRRFYQDGRELAPEELPMQVAAATGREIRDEELDVLLPSGRWITIWGSATPLFDDHGQVRGCLGAFMDVSERKRVMEELVGARAELERRVAIRTRQLQLRADQLARLSSELTLAEQRERRRLAALLHDHLQQLLVAARLGLEALARHAGEQERNRVDNVSGLIIEAIAAARSLTTELAPPVLHSGLAAGLEWLARWMEEKHGLHVELVVEGEAAADRDEVRILLFESVRELLFNVVKHAGVGTASVRLSLDASRLRVEVADCGRGFEPDVLLADGRSTEGGFGLLSIRERLALLGGKLEIASAPGAGASFVLVVPRAGGPAAGRAATPTGKIGPGPLIAPLRTEGRRFRILLVDDHEVMRRGLALLLEDEEDLEVVGEAADGEEALRQVAALRPDLVIMDQSMPVMDGVEATRRLTRQLPHVRVIGLSMHEEADCSAAMLDAGAAAYVTKSERSDLLIETIRTVCRHATGEQA